MVDAELPSRVAGDELEGLGGIDAAVADRLRRLGVEAAGQLRRVGVEGDLDLVRPPVTEAPRPGSVGGDRLRDLVALQHVLEGPDGEAEILGEADEHQDLVLAITVAVDEALAVEDLDERVELEVAAGRHDAGSCRLLQVEIPLPLGLVLAGSGERIANDRLDTHTRLWVANLLVIAPVRLLDVLPQGEFDRRLGRELQPLGWLAPA